MVQNNQTTVNQSAENLTEDIEEVKEFIPYQECAEDLKHLAGLYGLTNDEYQYSIDENVSCALGLMNPVSEVLDIMDFLRIEKNMNSSTNHLNDQMIEMEYKIIKPELFDEYKEYKNKINFTNMVEKYEEESRQAYAQSRLGGMCPSGAKCAAEGVALAKEKKKLINRMYFFSALAFIASLGALFVSKCSCSSHKVEENAPRAIQKAHIEKAQNIR